MDIAAFQLALKARAATDTGSGGLFNATTPLINAWYPAIVPSGTSFPYVVTNIAAAVSDNAFTKDIVPITVRMSVFHERESHTDPDTYTTCGSILKRIYGNWSSGSPGTAPTFGFHRHTLVIASGNWAGGIMEHASTREEHEPQYWHFIAEYRLWLSQ